uniref:Uncharacterized protein n=1 Tax=Falco tinnunculus TaxID=100819 RepID=A0A8C4UJW4_FALTI
VAGLLSPLVAQGLLHLGAGVIALLLAVVAVCSLPSLMDYWRQWWVMKPIPGISPCYPVLGNALQLERGAEGKGSLCHSSAVRPCIAWGFAGGASAGSVLGWLSCGVCHVKVALAVLSVDPSGCVCDACVHQSALCPCIPGCAARREGTWVMGVW